MINILRKIKGHIKHSEAIANDKYAMKQEDLDAIPKFGDLFEAVPLAALYSLLDKVAPARFNQGDLGLCFAFGGCGIAEFFLRNDETNPITEELAEMFLGYYSRYILNGNQPPEGDDGSTILATLQALQQFGICVSTLWPYEDANEDVEPSKDAQTAAANIEVDQVFKIPQTQDQAKLDAMKQAISQGMPLDAGWNVDDSIMNVGSDGMEPYVANPLVQGQVAGHSRYIFGYDDTITTPNAPIGGAFQVMNSWSASWGNNGWSWVSYQTFLDQETDDMGIISLKSGTPTPPDGPVSPSNPDISQAIILINKAVDKLNKAVTILEAVKEDDSFRDDTAKIAIDALEKVKDVVDNL